MARKTDIRLRRSAVSGAVPGGADLNLGELALNTADGAIFVKNGDGDIVTVSHDGIIHYDEPNSRVGIGTTSPTSKLHVNSGANDVVAIFQSTDDYADIRLTDSTGSSHLRNQHGHLFIQADREDAVNNTTIRFSVDNSEKARIDSSGQLLIGKTATDNTTVGTRISNGFISSVVDGDNAILLNRLTSDGSIALFRKDGTTVGSIGVSSSTKLYIGAGDSAVRFDPDGNSIRPHNASTNGSTDAVLDLGTSGNRFKDLHLSGNVNASAAYIDGYIYHTGDSDTYINYSTDNIILSAGGPLMHLKGSGRVGIGTTSPGSILHISNASSPEIRLEDSDATSTFNITTFQNAAGNLNFNTREDDGTFVSTDYQIVKNAAGANIHKWFIGNSEKLRLDASGRLGIGTTSPDAPLTVHNSSDPEIRFGYSSTQDHRINWDSSKVFIDADPENANGSSAIGFRVDGSEKVRIDSSGNVGIGDTTPDSKLTVQGDVLARDEFRGEVVSYSSNQDAPYLIASTSGYTGATTNWNTYGFQHRFKTTATGAPRVTIDTYLGEAFAVTNNNRVGIGTSSPANKLHVSDGGGAGLEINPQTANDRVILFAYDRNASTYQSMDFDALDYHFNPGGTEKMRLTNDGKLGIGTSSPAALLHLGNAGHLLFERGGEVRSRDTSGNIKTIARVNGSNELEYGWSSSGPVKFMGGGSYSERMRVHTNGNIAINQTAAPHTLTVRGTISRVNSSGIQIINLQSNNDAGQIAINNSGGTQRIKLDSAGDSWFTGGGVGIGTSTPDGKLEVAGGSTGIVLSNAGDSSAYDQVSMTYNGYNSGTPEFEFKPKTAPGSGNVNSFFRFSTLTGGGGGSNTANLTVDGKVGIGKTTPSADLDIENGSGATLFMGDTNGRNLRFRTANSGSQNTNISSYAGLYLGGADNQNHMLIDGTGKVGIGLTAPDSRLHIEQSAVALSTTTLDNGTVLGLQITMPDATISGTPGVGIGLGMHGRGRSYLVNTHTGTNKDSSELSIYTESGGTISESLKVTHDGKLEVNEAFTIPNSIGSAGQVLKVPTSGTELIWGAASGGGAGSSISDNDDDTKIQVEESADEDIIRFDIAGTQKMLLNSTELNLTGDLAVSGNLNIAGDINSTSVTNLDVTDKTITVANNAGSAANANGAGIVVDTGTNNPQMIYTSGTDEWDFNRSIDINGGSGTGLKIHQGGAIVGAKSGGDTQLMYWGGGPVYYGRSSLGGTVTGHEFRVGGTTKLNVNSSGNTIASGNVGIGDTAPQDYLEINGSGKGLGGLTISNSSHNHAALSFARSSTATARIFTTEPNATHTSQLNFQTSDASGSSPNLVTAMVIDDNQKVGIGTTGPSQPLHVKHSSTHQMRLQGSNSYWNIGTGWSGYYQDYLLFATNTGEKMVIDTNGNVGIGVNGPSAKLHIVNNSTDDTLLLSSTEDSSSAAPVLTFNRDSASPADADYLGQLKFKGENDADQDVVYAKITAKIQDASDGSEDGLIEFANRKAGSNEITARLRSDSLQLLNNTSLALKSDGAQIQLGNDNDMQIYHNGSAGEINNGTGDFTIDSVGDIILDADGGDVTLLDNGTQYAKFTNFLGGLAITSGGTNALVIGGTDGSMIMGGNVSLGDNKKLDLGNNDDLLIYHDATDSLIENATGHLKIINKANDSDILFQTDDGSGGVATYLTIDGSSEVTFASKPITFFNGIKANFGDGHDLQIFHDGSNSFINNTGGAAGALSIKSHDINLMSSASETMASFVEDGGVNLYFNNSKKLETVTGGVETTGYLSTTAGAYFNTNTGSNPVYITRQGNTNESLKIHVGDSAAMFESIQDENEDNYGSFIFAMDSGPSEPYFDIRKGTAASGSKFYVDGSGAVGIGTMTPSGGLHVANNFVRVDNSEGVAARKLRSSYFSNGQDLTLESGSSADIIMTTTNVGISETNPVHKVEAKGTDAALVVHNNGNSRGGIVALASQLVGFTSTSVNDDLVFGHAGNPIASSAFNEKMRIDNGTGNVSIGTSASGARKLDVLDNGDVNGEIIQIKGNANYGAVITYHRGGSYAWEAGIGGGSSQDANIPASYWGVGERAASGRPARFLIAHTSGNVGIGVTPQTSGNVKLRVGGAVRIEEYTIDTTTTSTSSTSTVTLHSFPIANFRTARFTIQISNTTDSTYHSTEILAVHDGTTANITEFGEVHTGSSVEATFDADIDSNNFRLRATPTSTNGMEFKVVCHSIQV